VQQFQGILYKCTGVSGILYSGWPCRERVGKGYMIERGAGEIGQSKWKWNENEKVKYVCIYIGMVCVGMRYRPSCKGYIPLLRFLVSNVSIFYTIRAGVPENRGFSAMLLLLFSSYF
jgi:hypothetical protein